MEPVSQNYDRVAQWCAANPTLLAFGLFLFGLAFVAAAWAVGILSTATTVVIGIFYVGALVAFIGVHFGVDVFIGRLRFIWFCLAAIWGLFNR